MRTVSGSADRERSGLRVVGHERVGLSRPDDGRQRAIVVGGDDGRVREEPARHALEVSPRVDREADRGTVDRLDARSREHDGARLDDRTR
jgi:hypothetical protein